MIKKKQWNQITVGQKYSPILWLWVLPECSTLPASIQMQYLDPEIQHLHFASAKLEAKGQNGRCDQLYLHKRENTKWIFQSRIVQGVLDLYTETWSQGATSVNGKILCWWAPPTTTTQNIHRNKRKTALWIAACCVWSILSHVHSCPF